MLGSLAAGDGSYRLTQECFRFRERVQDSKIPISPVFDGAVKSLHEQAFATGADDDSIHATRRSERHRLSRRS